MQSAPQSRSIAIDARIDPLALRHGTRSGQGGSLRLALARPPASIATDPRSAIGRREVRLRPRWLPPCLLRHRRRDRIHPGRAADCRGPLRRVPHARPREGRGLARDPRLDRHFACRFTRTRFPERRTTARLATSSRTTCLPGSGSDAKADRCIAGRWGDSISPDGIHPSDRASSAIRAGARRCFAFEFMRLPDGPCDLPGDSYRSPSFLWHAADSAHARATGGCGTGSKPRTGRFRARACHRARGTTAIRITRRGAAGPGSAPSRSPRSRPECRASRAAWAPSSALRDRPARRATAESPASRRRRRTRAP